MFNKILKKSLKFKSSICRRFMLDLSTWFYYSLKLKKKSWIIIKMLQLSNYKTQNPTKRRISDKRTKLEAS